MDDRSNKAYASLPERLYVVQDGQVVYQVRLLIVIRFLLLLLLSYALLPERLYVVQDGEVVYNINIDDEDGDVVVVVDDYDIIPGWFGPI